MMLKFDSTFTGLKFYGGVQNSTDIDGRRYICQSKAVHKRICMVDVEHGQEKCLKHRHVQLQTSRGRVEM